MAKFEKIEVTPKLRRKLAEKFDKTESCIYNWLAEREQGTAGGDVLKCRNYAIKMGAKVWVTER